MREIKFRAWDSNLSKLEYYDNWESLHNALCWRLEGENYIYDLEFTQFTGLKDINGKEIYEGDILKVDYLIEEGRFIFSNLVVKYEPAHFYAHHEKGNNLENFKYYGFDNSHIDSDGINVDRTVEIIGNIYENSDLLKP